MIKKSLNPKTKEATFSYPAYLKKAPITVSIQSSYQASVLHDIYQMKFVTSEITKFINARSKAYNSHNAWTPARIQAIGMLRELVKNHQEGKLLPLCIAIVRHKPAFQELAPHYNSPKRAYYDLSIQCIIDNVTEIVMVRAPYCGVIVKV